MGSAEWLLFGCLMGLLSDGGSNWRHHRPDKDGCQEASRKGICCWELKGTVTLVTLPALAKWVGFSQMDTVFKNKCLKSELSQTQVGNHAASFLLHSLGQNRLTEIVLYGQDGEIGTGFTPLQMKQNNEMRVFRTLYFRQ